MADFVSYVLFMVIGITVAAFISYFAVQRLWRKDPKDARDAMALITAAIAAIFGASR
jgi:predicted permease